MCNLQVISTALLAIAWAFFAISLIIIDIKKYKENSNLIIENSKKFSQIKASKDKNISNG